jgi:hypothetical protein
MLLAYHLARDAPPDYSCRFSRRDFTLPQLLACPVVKEHLGRGYRGAEALLRDAGHWCKAVGMREVPDHNTLWRAASFLLAKCRVARLLDAVARWAAPARAPGLSLVPLSIDSTYFEPRHVSRHYERRLREARKGRAAWRTRAGPRARRAAGAAGITAGRGKTPEAAELAHPQAAAQAHARRRRPLPPGPVAGGVDRRRVRLPALPARALRRPAAGAQPPLQGRRRQRL